MAGRTITLVDVRGDQAHQVEVLDDGRVRVDDGIYEVRGERDGSVRVIRNRATRCWTAVDGDTRSVFVEGRVYELAEQLPEVKARRAGHHGSLSAPMPATVRRILVKAGDSVKAGESLVILEAMKMELPVRAATAGTIRAISCREGELVQPGVTLIEMDES
jgi:biotin carboxyl carrier protein